MKISKAWNELTSIIGYIIGPAIFCLVFAGCNETSARIELRGTLRNRNGTRLPNRQAYAFIQAYFSSGPVTITGPLISDSNGRFSTILIGSYIRIQEPLQAIVTYLCNDLNCSQYRYEGTLSNPLLNYNNANHTFTGTVEGTYFTND